MNAGAGSRNRDPGATATEHEHSMSGSPKCLSDHNGDFLQEALQVTLPSHKE